MLTSEAPFAFLNGKKVRMTFLVETTKLIADPESLRVKDEVEAAKPNPTYIAPERVDTIRMNEVFYRDTPRRRVKQTRGKGNKGGGGRRGFSTPPSGL